LSRFPVDLSQVDLACVLTKTIEWRKMAPAISVVNMGAMTFQLVFVAYLLYTDQAVFFLYAISFGDLYIFFAKESKKFLCDAKKDHRFATSFKI
jgi:hypothetical protein